MEKLLAYMPTCWISYMPMTRDNYTLLSFKPFYKIYATIYEKLLALYMSSYKRTNASHIISI